MQDDKGNSGVMSSILTELGVFPPEGGDQVAMTIEQQEIIAAYRTGRITQKQFERHLSDDPGLANHLARLSPADRGERS
ncbi:hypothetical protein J2T09_005273 [Neorhizobium huautlense]|uniref:Uncharacterized protein n=1 Tax=Neorhizobium huautlense TaxID=67774 RepID=A0ABT9Q2A0_9HYPH|nr:hypothetical protein [Neorhizobium huautlense]MDP9840486.1 hypothetical protein [Neorhizobium huautlense]